METKNEQAKKDKWVLWALRALQGVVVLLLIYTTWAYATNVIHTPFGSYRFFSWYTLENMRISKEIFNCLWFPYTVLLVRYLVYIAALVISELVYQLVRSVFRERTPFLHENVLRLRVVGGLVLGVEATQLLQRWLVSLAMMWGDWGQGYTMGYISLKVEAADVMLLVVGVGLLCLAAAFRRGIRLQQESDETL